MQRGWLDAANQRLAAKPLGIKAVYGVIVLCSIAFSARLVFTLPGQEGQSFWSRIGASASPGRTDAAFGDVDDSDVRAASQAPPAVPQAWLRAPHVPLARNMSIKAARCELRQVADIAGTPPCQEVQPPRGKEDYTAKVALLFLVQDQIPTEPIWTAFIASAAELQLRIHVQPTRPGPPDLFSKIPTDPQERRSKCWSHGGRYVGLKVPPRQKYRGMAGPFITNVTGWLQEGCSAGLSGEELYEMQSLFSIYVHRSPDKASAPRGSVFHGRDVPVRIQGKFAQPSLVHAHRLLLTEALKDKANSVFVLMSEGCVPMYHPALFWAQLISSSHISRVSDGPFGVHRWSSKMETEHLKLEHFRKGSQFLALTHSHAQYVAYDRHVWTQFQTYCRTQLGCDRKNRYDGHVCVADEHFIPTLLQAYDMKDTVDRIGILTFVDWKSEGGWHPKTFYPGDTLQALYSMRTRTGPGGCEAMPLRAMHTASELFYHDDLCRATGDQIVPLEGKYSEPWPEPDEPMLGYRKPAKRPNNDRAAGGAQRGGRNGQGGKERRRGGLASGGERAVAGGQAARGTGSARGTANSTRLDTRTLLQQDTDEGAMLEEAALAGGFARRGLRAGVGLAEPGRAGGAGAGARARTADLAGGQRASKVPPKARKRKPPMELGSERSQWLLGRAKAIRAAQEENLRRTGWLGGFEPMLHTCPLTARKVSPEAVSEFASVAWRCDGLGFAWECLHPGELAKVRSAGAEAASARGSGGASERRR